MYNVENCSTVLENAACFMRLEVYSTVVIHLWVYLLL